MRAMVSRTSMKLLLWLSGRGGLRGRSRPDADMGGGETGSSGGEPTGCCGPAEEYECAREKRAGDCVAGRGRLSWQAAAEWSVWCHL